MPSVVDGCDHGWNFLHVFLPYLRLNRAPIPLPAYLLPQRFYFYYNQFVIAQAEELQITLVELKAAVLKEIDYIISKFGVKM